ncbi:MAG: hypothetical protein ACYCZK_07355, partial [Microbacteriaceae bacterium]
MRKSPRVMIDTLEYKQHARVQERVIQGPPTVHTAAKSLQPEDTPINRANRRIGLGITKSVGTMWCAYAFALLALVSLPAAIASHDPIIIVAWIAQTFLQLVLLPVIIVGQNIQAAAADGPIGSHLRGCGRDPGVGQADSTASGRSGYGHQRASGQGEESGELPEGVTTGEQGYRCAARHARTSPCQKGAVHKTGT